MNYAQVYVRLMADRRLKEPAEKPYEVHHIIPRCLGGSDAPENLIRLSCSDHLFAHILLAKIHPENHKLVSAAARMSGMRRYRGRHSRLRYTRLRTNLSRLMVGNVRAKALRHTQEFKDNLSARTKGKKYALGLKRPPEFGERVRQQMLGNTLNLGKKRPHKPETIEKLRTAALARHARARIVS